jgi:hypothetical protein
VRGGSGLKLYVHIKRRRGREREVLLMGFCVCTETIDETVLCDAVGEVEADVGC